MPTIADLRFSECAYFYKLRDRITITATDIHDMLVEVTEGKVRRNYAVDEERMPSGVAGVNFSMRVFKCKPEPPKFITRNGQGWEEQKIGYFLFIEYQNYVVILRRNASVPKFISDKLENIDYDDLIALKANVNTSFKRLSMQNLDGSDKAMRYKSFEALNLTDNISPLGLNRYYVRTVKGSNGDNDNFSLTLYASRINEFEGNLTIDDVCGWAKRKIDEITALHGQIPDTLLTSFASPEKYSAVYKNLVPSSILVFYGLLSSMNEEMNAEFWRTDGHGRRTTQIDAAVFERYIKTFGKAFTQINTVRRGSQNHYYFGNNDSVEIRILSSGIKLNCKSWEDILIINSTDGRYDGTLLDFFNNYQQFNVYFNTPGVVYSSRMLFCDKRLIQNIPQLMKVLQPKGWLLRLSYEKHDRGRGSVRGLNDWHQDSIFYQVEQHEMGNYTHFICDDCNDEWADHIGVSDDKVTFFCSKHKDSTDSASDFQDVVGQALKNLANLAPTQQQLAGKVASWDGPYQTSNIPRLRSNSGTVQDAINVWMANENSPNFERTMCLVVDFLSYTRFEGQLNNMAVTYPNNIDSELYQRLWLLSSFVSACLDMGVRPLIYCKP